MQYTNIYFVGAGGIGMSALERYFNQNGYRVGGYDKTPSPLTEALIQEGIDIHFEDNIDAVASDFKDPATTLVCYTPAIPKEHGELSYFRQNGFEVVKRSQLLGLITQSERGLCVAGTHGKTTTSSMIAHILKQSHVDCNAFLGGILKPYDSNLMLSQKSDLTVIEADEFDRSFHTLSPYMAVITSCDPDHLDIYGTEEAYRASFAHFVSLVRPDGLLLKHAGIKVDCSQLNANARYAEYGLVNDPTKEASLPDYYATNIRIGNGTILFDYVARKEGWTLRDLEPGVPVPINVDNATAAITICLLNGCTEEEVRTALKSFGGAKRRFDFYVKRSDLVIMDDYAHHPDEIKASLTSVAKLFEGRQVTVVFQPHLYSRTHDLADGFASALSIPERTILLPIYPAREQPIPGITSEWLLDKIEAVDAQSGKQAQRYVKHQDEIIAHLQELRAQGNLDVLVMMGAGVDIERLVRPVADALQ
ncbi:MAG: UDP-N-acetylmuramate--L-alanine ligase [Bacteroidales bacterium]|nr:UDP-N-acetylmuramate--L-alanine ligase [Bacteroidales bacterium]